MESETTEQMKHKPLRTQFISRLLGFSIFLNLSSIFGQLKMKFSLDGTLFLASLATAIVLSLTFQSLWVRWQNYQEARRLGCQPPPKFPTKLPFGIDIVRGIVRANKEMRGLEHIRAVMGSTLSKSFQIGFVKGILTADEENIQAILAKQFDNFELGGIRRDIMFPLLGDGIFTQDGLEWRHSRALLRPSFSKRQISDLELEEKHTQNLMSCLSAVSSCDNWTQEVDLQPLFFRFTLDSSSEFLFGATVNSQLQGLNELSNNTSKETSAGNFSTNFDAAMEGLEIRAVFFGLGKYIWPSGFRQACKVCHDFVDNYVQKQWALRNDRLAQLSDNNTKYKYLFFDALAADMTNPLELRYQLLNILIAGRDTTAGLLAFIFYSLARDPVRYKKLRTIILADFGTYDEDPRNRISFDTLKNCKYLQWVIDETLRLYPIVPENSRRAVRNTTLPRGGGSDGKSKIFVAKGNVVSYSIYIMHRRRDIWGEDADEFNPERWKGRKLGWEYLPVCFHAHFIIITANVA